jgi:ribonuclease HII
MSSKTYPSLSFEQDLWAKGPRFVIGIDEVGRGAIAGPVAVGVAVVDKRQIEAKGPWPQQLCDSKLISEKVRNTIVEPVRDWVRASAVGMVSAKEIDDHGIVPALSSSAAKALEELFSDITLRQELVTDGAVVILDGSHNWIGSKASGIEVVVRTKADRDCVSVAAASVIAKVERDNLMIALDLEVPGYGIAGHKGYASANHIAALQSLGPSSIHRLSWLTKILAPR